MMKNRIGPVGWSKDDPPFVLYRRQIDKEVKRITDAAVTDNLDYEHSSVVAPITVCQLLEFFVEVESKGRPVTHLVVDADTFANMRQWDDVVHQGDVQQRAAGWFGTIWTVRIYMREFGKPRRVFLGSLVDGMDDCGMRFTLHNTF